MPNEGKPDLMNYVLQKASNAYFDWLCLLWTNPSYVPSNASVYSDLVEATFGGYTRITLTHSLWTSPVIVSDEAVSTWGTTPYTWTVTSSPQTIYGYAIIRPTSPVIYAIQALADPIPLVTGGIIGILPRLKFKTAA